LDRGSQYVLHVASVNNGTFPASQTVDFIGGTSHQDYAMISANVSLNWLFVNDYNTAYPSINASNPGDKTKTTATPKPKAYATHGNIALATALLGGSVAVVLIFFSMLPMFFRSNYVEEEHEKKALLQKGPEPTMNSSNTFSSNGFAFSSNGRHM
jgi:hypothetical protein